jgi:hypothetical protein
VCDRALFVRDLVCAGVKHGNLPGWVQLLPVNLRTWFSKSLSDSNTLVTYKHKSKITNKGTHAPGRVTRLGEFSTIRLFFVGSLGFLK